MKRSFRTLAVASAAAVALTLAACAPTGTAPEPDETATTPDVSYVPVNVGVGADAGYAAFFIADQHGLFEAAGLDVTLTPFATGGDALAALGAGQIQMTQSSPATITSIIANNPSITAFVETLNISGVLKVMLRNGVESAAEVQNFGYVAGLSQFLAYTYFEENNIDPESINWIPAGAGDMPALLMRGDIDGFFLWEPWPTNVLTAGTGHIGAVASEFPSISAGLVNWVATTDTWIAENEETARAITRVLAEATDIINTNPQAAAEAVEAAVAIKAEDALGMIDGFDYELKPITSDVAAVAEKIGDFFVETGSISSTPDLSSELVFDWSW